MENRLSIKEIAWEWREHLKNPIRFSDFWDCLTEDMEALTWRSPWGMRQSAQFAHDYLHCYEYPGFTADQIYKLFCNEDLYYRYLEEREKEKIG